MIAGNPMHDRRRSRDDGHIIRVGKRGHLAAAQDVRATIGKEITQPGHQAAIERIVQVPRIAAVYRDGHGGTPGMRVFAAINCQHRAG